MRKHLSTTRLTAAAVMSLALGFCYSGAMAQQGGGGSGQGGAGQSGSGPSGGSPQAAPSSGNSGQGSTSRSAPATGQSGSSAHGQSDTSGGSDTPSADRGTRSQGSSGDRSDSRRTGRSDTDRSDRADNDRSDIRRSQTDQNSTDNLNSDRRLDTDRTERNRIDLDRDDQFDSRTGDSDRTDRDEQNDERDQIDRGDRDGRRDGRRDFGARFFNDNSGRLIVRNLVTRGILGRAGFHNDDVIVSINGRRVTSVPIFEDILFATTGRVPVVVLRDGVQQTIYVDNFNEGARVDYGYDEDLYQTDRAWLGVFLDTRYDNAVVVQAVQEGSAADEAGIRAGDRITSVNGRRVNSPSQFTQTIGSMEPGDNVQLNVARWQARQIDAQLGERPATSSRYRYSENVDNVAP